MGKFVLTNCRVFFGAGDLSGDTNQATIAASREVKDTTNYLSAGWKEAISGLGSAKIAVDGFVEYGTAAVPLSDDIGSAAHGLVQGITLAPVGAADQAVAYFTNVLESEYDPLQGKVGDVAAFKLMAESSWPLVKGVIAVPPGNALSVTGTGTINNLGPVAAGQQIYADLHVLSVSGSPTITFTIQSAALVGFAGPTTRLTFTAATGQTSQILRAPGAITDAFWRAAWTVSGSGSVLASVAFGVV